MSCRLSRVGPATQPGGAAGPTLAPCAGPRLQPRAVGYVRLWLTDPPGHADALTGQLRAHRCGLALADTYTEQQPDVSSREGPAFRTLVAVLRRPQIRTVISPTPEHFSRFGGMYRAMRTVIDVEIGADVLIMAEGGDAS
jgi:hypothetical protein